MLYAHMYVLPSFLPVFVPGRWENKWIFSLYTLLPFPCQFFLVLCTKTGSLRVTFTARSTLRIMQKKICVAHPLIFWSISQFSPIHLDPHSNAFFQIETQKSEHLIWTERKFSFPKNRLIMNPKHCAVSVLFQLKLYWWSKLEEKQPCFSYSA